MTVGRRLDPLQIHHVERDVVTWSIGYQHHASNQRDICRALASIPDTLTGEVWLGTVTGEWVNESDLIALSNAIVPSEPHVPNWSDEGRCTVCHALPGHCDGGSA